MPKSTSLGRLLPIVQAVSKISRLAEHDRGDIVALARRGLVDAKRVRQRAEEALTGYVGGLERLRTSVEEIRRKPGSTGSAKGAMEIRRLTSRVWRASRRARRPR